MNQFNDSGAGRCSSRRKPRIALTTKSASSMSATLRHDASLPRDSTRRCSPRNQTSHLFRAAQITANRPGIQLGRRMASWSRSQGSGRVRWATNGGTVGSGKKAAGGRGSSSRSRSVSVPDTRGPLRELSCPQRALSVPIAWSAFPAFERSCPRVYGQIGLVMLIGLAAKNAILIVEFAKAGFEQGKTLTQAALDGARLRLRPILMTSFAFVLGCVPLWLAQGAGATGRQIMGTAVISGMLAATGRAIFIIPLLFVWVERRAGAERHKG